MKLTVNMEYPRELGCAESHAVLGLRLFQGSLKPTFQSIHVLHVQCHNSLLYITVHQFVLKDNNYVCCLHKIVLSESFTAYMF